MHSLAASFVLGYHGCDAGVGEKLLGGEDFKHSTNSYDWLGHGIYFWETNPRRGLEFAEELKNAPRGRGKIKKPAVVGAVIDLGFCLDLTTSAGVEQVRIAHARLTKIAARAKFKLPKNHGDGLRRHLDCAVIQALHGWAALNRPGRTGGGGGGSTSDPPERTSLHMVQPSMPASDRPCLT